MISKLTRTVVLATFLLALPAAGQQADCSTGAPSTLTPGQDALANSPVAFSWTPVATAVEYRVYIRTQNVGLTLLGTTTEPALIRPLPPGSFDWFVEATFRSCPSTRSNAARFTIASRSDCPATSFTPRFPLPGATVDSGRLPFDWADVDQAIGYAVILRPRHGQAAPLGFSRVSRTDQFVSPGEYFWTIQSFVDGCLTAPGDPVPFTVNLPEGCDLARPPVIISPERGDILSTSVRFDWSDVPGATAYRLYRLDREGNELLFATVPESRASANLPPGIYAWLVEALLEGCPAVRSSISFFAVDPRTGCGTLDAPVARALRKVVSEKSYDVHWRHVPRADRYEIEESTTPDFSANVTRLEREDTFATFTHTVIASEPYFYRVRAITSCGEPGAWSQNIRVVVADPVTGEVAGLVDQSSPLDDDEEISHQVFLPNDTGAPLEYSLTSDQPWLNVVIPTGTIPPGGTTVKLHTVHEGLSVGTNHASLVLETSPVSDSKLPGTESSHGVSIPVTVSLVTPVSSTPNDEPTPETLIIPAVAHTEGVSSFWQSDIRVANVSAVSHSYDFRFTPSGQDGSLAGEETTLNIAPGQTVAFDDILESLYGAGPLGENLGGALEIRPVPNQTSGEIIAPLATSRTYNVSEAGTLGQFVPAIQYAKFIGSVSSVNPSTISFQHVAESDSFRLNIGIVEASGQPATVRLRVFDSAGAMLDEFTEELKAGEHRQLGRPLVGRGITLEDGRIELAVVSPAGRVSGYASVIDNLSGDPRTVVPALLPSEPAAVFALPGVADVDTGAARWRTDIRAFNSGDSTETITLTFYPQGKPESSSEIFVDIEAGAVAVLDDVLGSHFDLKNTGGSVIVRSSSDSPLIVTARTFNLTDSGTRGQFIPSVTLEETIGAGDEPYQILQTEESERYRMNLGLAEVAGAPISVRISAIIPGQKSAVSRSVDLPAFGFIQENHILETLGFPNAYNARISLEVTTGSGRLAAYGSVIDNVTNDPTYIAPQ